jgi:hypothetical protein
MQIKLIIILKPRIDVINMLNRQSHSDCQLHHVSFQKVHCTETKISFEWFIYRLLL